MNLRSLNDGLHEKLVFLRSGFNCSESLNLLTEIFPDFLATK